jgi:aspartate/methionine/tyrosine aminotransferase
MNDPVLSRTLAMLAEPGSTYARRFDRTSMLDLSVGEARYPIPQTVRSEIAAVVGDLDTLWYTNPTGDIGLRQAFLRHRFGTETGRLDPAQVLITAGGKEAALLAVRYLLTRDGNTTVLAPQPGWEPYGMWLRAVGATVIGYNPTELAVDAEGLRRMVADAHRRPGLLILNYPHNPTGLDIDQSHMDALMDAATELDLSVVSDEVYRAFANKPSSAAQAPAFDPHRHLVVDSCSKWLAAAGLRVGFLYADADTITAITGLRATYASCTSPLTQAVAHTLLTNPVATAWLDDVRATIAGTRDALAEHLTARGVPVTSAGGLYVWCRQPDQPLPPVSEPAAWLTDGTGFGAPDHVRICPARAGLDPRIAADAVIANLRGQ